jgi:hypothetical protein
MPDILIDVAGIIATNCSLTLGTTLQVHHRLQSAPDRCVLVTGYGGKPNYEFRKRIDYMLQVITRAISWKDASDDAWKVYKYMFEDGTSNVKLPVVTPKYTINAIHPLQAPTYIGPDESGRFEFSTNYQLIIIYN